MTKYQIETLISRWLEEALDEAEDARAMGGPIADLVGPLIFGPN